MACVDVSVWATVTLPEIPSPLVIDIPVPLVIDLFAHVSEAVLTAKPVPVNPAIAVKSASFGCSVDKSITPSI